MTEYDTWHHEFDINLTGQAGSGANYVVPITLNADGAGSNVNLDGEGESADFGDLRFASDNRAAELDYFIIDPSANPCTALVEVTADLGSNQTIKGVIGKTGQSDASDIREIGDLGDHFLVPADDINTDKWTYYDNGDGQQNAVSSSVLYVAAARENSYAGECRSDDTFQSPFRLKWRGTIPDATTIPTQGTRSADNADRVEFYEDGSAHLIRAKKDAGDTTSAAFTQTINSYKILDIVLNDGVASYFENGTEAPNSPLESNVPADGTDPMEVFFQSRFKSPGGIYVDWVCVLPYHLSEPAWNSTGAITAITGATIPIMDHHYRRLRS